jgi:hypothetical protein
LPSTWRSGGEPVQVFRARMGGLQLPDQECLLLAHPMPRTWGKEGWGQFPHYTAAGCRESYSFCRRTTYNVIMTLVTRRVKLADFWGRLLSWWNRVHWVALYILRNLRKLFS